ncbi:MAG: DUF1028 domain-containing protein [Burkholderiales bacterium]|nr:DUF1028 domain-containing protein [Burkholderiales bacterium]
MTFQIAGRCDRTGRFGVAIATRPIAVGARCPFFAPGQGVVVTMAFTDPRLGPLGTRLLKLGYSARRVLAELAASDPYIEHRQLCVIDRDGHAVARTGAHNKVWSGAFTERNVVAMGNNLTSEKTARVMYDLWTGTGDLPLEERLLAALEAGRDAGGQNGGQHSSALAVYGGEINAYVDLRVDEHAEPVAELRRVYEAFKPLVPYYYVRPGSDPGVLGREPEWLEREGRK